MLNTVYWKLAQTCCTKFLLPYLDLKVWRKAQLSKIYFLTKFPPTAFKPPEMSHEILYSVKLSVNIFFPILSTH